MPRYKLRTLLIVLGLGPPLLAGIYFTALAWSKDDPATIIANSVLLVVLLLFLWRVAFGPRKPWKLI